MFRLLCEASKGLMKALNHLRHHNDCENNDLIFSLHPGSGREALESLSSKFTTK